jgi:hypothetical protein
MRGYTTIEQSKKLLELGLDPESADMLWDETEKFPRCIKHYHEYLSQSIPPIPCWSLSALIIILAKIALEYDDDGSVSLQSFMGTWSLNMFDCPIKCLDGYDNPVDICVDMLIHILENNFIKKGE